MWLEKHRNWISFAFDKATHSFNNLYVNSQLDNAGLVDNQNELA